MAFRRSVTARTNILFQQQQRVAVPFSRIDRDDSERENLPHHNLIYKRSGIPDILRRRLPFGVGANVGSFCGSRNLFQDRRFAIPAAFAPVSARKLSTLDEGPGAEMGDVLGETALQVAPAASQVAVAAADSSLPVAAIQYMIDYVHTFTGLNWWAAIVMTTILFRTLLLPFTIHHSKATSKFTLIRPQLEKIVKEVKSMNMTPAAVLDGRARKAKLYKEYGVTPFTPLKGILIGGPVFLCFFLAINNMAGKVHSFKEGGALWFNDLTTPDAMYILPVLTALTLWITMERNAQQGLGGDPAAKFVSRAFAVLTIPVTAHFPEAIFCYWITSNVYTISYGLVIKKPEVKQMLGIPDIPLPPLSTNQKPAPSFIDALKEFAAHQQQLKFLSPPPQQSLSLPEQSLSPTPVDEALKPVNRSIQSSAAELSGRIKNLKKEVKRKKKGNKRSSR